MRATDIIRSVLDLIDQVDSKEQSTELTIGDPEDNETRFRDIFAKLASQKSAPFSNTPMEIVTDVDTVTTKIGGGPNGIKHPDDIRVKDPRGYE